MSELDPSLSELDGDALLAAVRARIAGALLGLAGGPYDAALLSLPEPMRVVHALDKLGDALATTPRDGALDRRFVTDAIEALLRIGLRTQALALAEACGTDRAVPRARISTLEELDPSLRSWDRALAAFLESERTFLH